MAYKTKAALHGRQCSTENKEHTQITRVSAGGQSLSELHNHNSVLVGFSSNREEVSKTYIRQWRTLGHTAKNYPDIGYHSFGSMPRCCNSLRIILLIQAASDSSPSCCWACSISSRNPGSSLNWNGGLPRLSFLCVDTSITPDVMCLCVMTHYIHVLQIATPRSAGTLPRRLTKPLYEVTIMADNQHTQTHPKKVVLPHVRRIPEDVQATLDPFILALYRERRELLCRFKQALEAAGVEYVEADYD